jgi:hypothetical protein
MLVFLSLVAMVWRSRGMKERRTALVLCMCASFVLITSGEADSTSHSSGYPHLFQLRVSIPFITSVWLHTPVYLSYENITMTGVLAHRMKFMHPCVLLLETTSKWCYCTS